MVVNKEARADDFPSAWDEPTANESQLDGDQKPPADGFGSTSKDSNQSKIFGVFARIQPTGSPITACDKPFCRGYRNFFLGEISDAGTMGIAFMTFSYIFPRYLDDTLARQKSKDLGLPVNLRFRALSGIVRGSYIAAYWFALAASLSATGIDVKVSGYEIFGKPLFEASRRTQERMDGRNESVAENFTKIGFLAGFPVAYAIFRDGWSLPAMHRTIPHLLPLKRLPLYVGLACISAGAFNVWSFQNYWRQQVTVERPRKAT